MNIASLELEHFRNHTHETIRFAANWNILVGDNGAGKTNILEALYYTSTSRSPRTAHIYDMIQWGNPSCVVRAEIQGAHTEGMVVHTLSHSTEHEITLNDVPYKGYALAGKIPLVYFIPDDVMALKGEASHRRKIIDFVLVQLYPHYKFLLTQYRRVVLERNALLRRIREGIDRAAQLEPWDTTLVKHSIALYTKRVEMIATTNRFLTTLARDMFGAGTLTMEYEHFLKRHSTVVDEPSIRTALAAMRDEEIKYGMTLCGPHRDDIVFLLDGHDVRKFASQGQQRATMLVLKCATARVLEETLHEQPLMIFDDVFSELDAAKKEALMRVLTHNHQVFLSTTSLDGIRDFVGSDAHTIHVNNGKVDIR